MGRTAVNVAGQALVPTVVAQRHRLIETAAVAGEGSVEETGAVAAR